MKVPFKVDAEIETNVLSLAPHSSFFVYCESRFGSPHKSKPYLCLFFNASVLHLSAEKSNFLYRVSLQLLQSLDQPVRHSLTFYFLMH